MQARAVAAAIAERSPEHASRACVAGGGLLGTAAGSLNTTTRMTRTRRARAIFKLRELEISSTHTAYCKSRKFGVRPGPRQCRIVVGSGPAGQARPGWADQVGIATLHGPSPPGLRPGPGPIRV